VGGPTHPPIGKRTEDAYITSSKIVAHTINFTFMKKTYQNMNGMDII